MVCTMAATRRWLTPRPLEPCVSRHIKLDHTRNHRPGRVRTWPRLQSGRTSTAKIAVPTHPPSPGGLRVGTDPHSSLRRARKKGAPSVAAHSSRRRVGPPSRGSCCRVRGLQAHLGSESPLGSRSRPWHAPVPGAAWVALARAWAPCAAHTAPACITLRLARDTRRSILQPLRVRRGFQDIL